MGCTLQSMTLNAYLVEHGLKDEDFAVRVGCDRTTIYRIRRKGQRPSPALMEKIAEETGGLVQPNDFYGLSGLAA
jgi:transcriptional regulator with XRE-family HTH domain